METLHIVCFQLNTQMQELLKSPLPCSFNFASIETQQEISPKGTAQRQWSLIYNKSHKNNMMGSYVLISSRCLKACSLCWVVDVCAVTMQCASSLCGSRLLAERQGKRGLFVCLFFHFDPVKIELVVTNIKNSFHTHFSIISVYLGKISKEKTLFENLPSLFKDLLCG